jgi:hypothetical protein
MARQGRQGKAGRARRGRARRGKAGQGKARRGKARQARQGMAWHGVARQGKAGKAWQGRHNTTTGRHNMATEISLQRVKREIAHIEITGTAPLIVHNWSQKARQEMLDKQMGKKSVKQLKDPQADFESSKYQLLDGRPGFPIMAFKSATVKGGGRIYGKAVKMTELRQNFTFLPDGIDAAGMQLAAIKSDEPIMREDMVRVGMGTADIRYRAEYREWSAVLKIQFVPSLIDLESVVALVDAGGTAGVGEWRPEKNGSFGTYEVTGG